VLEEIADAGLLLLGTHLAAPTGGSVRRENGSMLRFDTA